MPDAEIAANPPCSRPGRPTGAAERRQRLDDSAARSVSRSTRDWSRSTSAACRPSGPRHPMPMPRAPSVPARRRLHGGLDRQPPLCRRRDRPRRAGPHPRPRLPARTRTSLSRATRGHPRGMALPADQGFAAGSIAVGGDSAGANLTLALLLALRARGLPMPCCGWLVSPWSDLTASGATMRDQGGRRSDDPKTLSARTRGGLRRRQGSRRSADLAAACCSRRPAAAADPGRVGGDLARRCGDAGRPRRRGWRGRDARGLAEMIHAFPMFFPAWRRPGARRPAPAPSCAVTSPSGLEPPMMHRRCPMSSFPQPGTQ